jgi:hypothetical protein
MRTPKRDDRLFLAPRNKAEYMTVSHNGRHHLIGFLRMDGKLFLQLHPNVYARCGIDFDFAFVFVI